MKIHTAPQRSQEWLDYRLGKPSASQAAKLITPGGKLSESSTLYMAELIGEKLFKRPIGRDISDNRAVRHGVETEAEAAGVAQQLLLGKELVESGFCTDDDERYGCSPDRFVTGGNSRELLEIKCPYELPRHICNVLYGAEGVISGTGWGKDYKAQVQFQLLVTGCDAVNFMSYYKKCPSLMVRVERDPKFIAALAAILDRFCEQIEIGYERAQRLGAWG